MAWNRTKNTSFSPPSGRRCSNVAAHTDHRWMKHITDFRDQLKGSQSLGSTSSARRDVALLGDNLKMQPFA